MRTKAPHLLAIAWTLIAVLFSLFTVWAFYVQTVNNNPLFPAFVSLAFAAGSAFFAAALRKDLNRSESVRKAGIITVVVTAPWVPFWAWVAQVDDAPGAMVLALGFLSLAGLGLYTWHKAKNETVAA